MRAVRVRVGGWVQGVGFRAFVARRARERGLGGWVRNLSSGEVETEAFGAEADLQQFVSELREGPGRGLVTQFSVEWFDRSDAPPGFHITG